MCAALAERRVPAGLLGAGLPAAALAAAVRRTGPAAVFLFARRPGSRRPLLWPAAAAAPGAPRRWSAAPAGPAAAAAAGRAGHSSWPTRSKEAVLAVVHV